MYKVSMLHTWFAMFYFEIGLKIKVGTCAFDKSNQNIVVFRLYDLIMTEISHRWKLFYDFNRYFDVIKFVDVRKLRKGLEDFNFFSKFEYIFLSFYFFNEFKKYFKVWYIKNFTEFYKFCGLDVAISSSISQFLDKISDFIAKISSKIFLQHNSNFDVCSKNIKILVWNIKFVCVFQKNV